MDTNSIGRFSPPLDLQFFEDYEITDFDLRQDGPYCSEEGFENILYEKSMELFDSNSRNSTNLKDGLQTIESNQERNRDYSQVVPERKETEIGESSTGLHGNNENDQDTDMQQVPDCKTIESGVENSEIEYHRKISDNNEDFQQVPEIASGNWQEVPTPAFLVGNLEKDVCGSFFIELINSSDTQYRSLNSLEATTDTSTSLLSSPQVQQATGSIGISNFSVTAAQPNVSFATASAPPTCTVEIFNITNDVAFNNQSQVTYQSTLPTVPASLPDFSSAGLVNPSYKNHFLFDDGTELSKCGGSAAGNNYMDLDPSNISKERSDNYQALRSELNPYKSDDEKSLENLESDLRSRIRRKMMGHELAKTGGKDYKHATRRVLAQILTDHVANEYNWEGRGGKKSFKKYVHINAVIFDAVEQIFEGTKKYDVENCVKDWLKFANHRINRKKIDTVESLALEILEMELQLSESERNAMVHKLAKTGWKDYKQATRKVMAGLLTDSRALEFNWAGRGNKKPFKKYKHINAVVFAAVEKMFNGTKKLDVENCIKDWLKFAEQRIARKNMK